MRSESYQIFFILILKIYCYNMSNKHVQFMYIPIPGVKSYFLIWYYFIQFGTFFPNDWYNSINFVTNATPNPPIKLFNPEYFRLKTLPASLEEHTKKTESKQLIVITAHFPLRSRTDRSIAHHMTTLREKLLQFSCCINSKTTGSRTELPAAERTNERKRASNADKKILKR